MTQHDPDIEVIRRYCPYYAAATQMLGRRWAAGVLRALVTGPARFSDIAAAIPGMTDKLLSQRLKDLEADGLVERRVHAGPPVRVEYRLTEKGDALSTILLDLNRWALKWIDLPADTDARPPMTLGIAGAQPRGRIACSNRSTTGPLTGAPRTTAAEPT